MKKFIYIPLLLVIALALLFVGYTFHMNNAGSISLSYLGQEWSGSVAALVGSVFLFGFVLGAFIVWFISLKLKLQVRHAKKRLQKVEKEVQNLRALPIKNDL